MQLTKNELVKAIDGKAIRIPENDFEIGGISIDSRTIKPKEVFFAIKGERYDGHDFLNEVHEKEGLFSVVERDIGRNAVLVKDTRIALSQLASFYRNKFTPLTVAITGSNGKTTTKRLTSLVLERKFNVLVSPRSYNNDIGIPLTIFKLRSECEILLLEFGMNYRGEIRHLSEVAQPKIGVITNIAPVHIGNIGSLEEILTEKLEATSFCHTVFINADDNMLMKAIEDLKRRKRVITFGIKKGDVKARDITLTVDGSIFKVDETEFFLSLIGRYNVYNALVSIAIGDELGIDRKEIATALQKAVPEEGRDRRIRIGDILIIDSTYNSNPVSLLSVLETLKLLKGRKIAVLGDMLELGEEAVRFHKEIGKRLNEFDIRALFTYGELAQVFAKETNLPSVSSYNDVSNLVSSLKCFVKAGDVILIKGSRKMKMERVVEGLGVGRKA